ncbi:MAG: hypothetical protein KDD53_04140 [Bdellovibrionales bacterium]|nr:hypothetical protein [Bdellovibrionales bacterium]
MVAIRINGEESPISAKNMPTLASVVELVKTSIDPEHMITSIKLNGEFLSDEDWTKDLGTETTWVLEVDTGTPEDYVRYRVKLCPKIVQNVEMTFKDSRELFQKGEMDEANKILIVAVNDLKAFFQWYGALVELVAGPLRSDFNIDSQMEELTEICKRICQQQLYQSWWALSETLENDLEPQLSKLESFFSALEQRIG